MILEDGVGVGVGLGSRPCIRGEGKRKYSVSMCCSHTLKRWQSDHFLGTAQPSYCATMSTCLRYALYVSIFLIFFFSLLFVWWPPCVGPHASKRVRTGLHVEVSLQAQRNRAAWTVDAGHPAMSWTSAPICKCCSLKICWPPKQWPPKQCWLVFFLF